MTTNIIPENSLPVELSVPDAVEAAYTCETEEVVCSLQKQLPVMIECDKELTPYLIANIRNKLKKLPQPRNIVLVDGIQRQQQPGMMPQGMMATMISQLREAVRGNVERIVIVLPHLDLLTTNTGGLTGEAKEVIPLLYENPELVWLGFKDASFPVPEVISNLFPTHVCLVGLNRNRLRYLVTQKESRKFGREFNPWLLYKYVSGINAVRLRRILSTLSGEDYPQDAKKVYNAIRLATLGSDMEVPNVDLQKDIGGYEKVKKQLTLEVLDLIVRKEALTDPEEVKRIEGLIPKGMLFYGPPGSGKAAPLTSKVLTPSGWKLMGDIKVGDKVIGKNGYPTKVIGVYPQGKKRAFEIEFSDSTKVECCEEHLWLTEVRHARKDRMRNRINNSFKVRNMKEIRETLLTKEGTPNHYLPLPEPVHFEPQKPIGIDPYLLGALLGNGCFTAGYAVFSSSYEELVKKVETKLPASLGMTPRVNGIDYNLVNKGNGQNNVLTNWLRENKLYDVKSVDKFIPPHCLLASVEDRIAIMHGLLDTDGEVDSSNNVIYYTSSPHLRDGMLELVRSLGGSATSKKETKEGKDAYRVYVVLPKEIPPFTVSYKLNKFTDRKYSPRKQISAIKDTGKDVEMQCIAVESPDHLYIMDDYVVTHNTFIAKALASALQACVIVVSGPELKSKWVGESEERLRQIFHKARKNSPSIIIFDELDSFATSRGTYSGSGVEHSMVNQLLTELDGVSTNKEMPVYVVGTTNFVESIDQAVTRAGRLEFHMHIGYPDADDRKAIIEIYNKKMGLKLTEESLKYAVRRTGRGYYTNRGTPFSGDDINAMCRSIARFRLRDNRNDETSNADIDRALTEYDEKLSLNAQEENLCAVHESGHAICSMNLDTTVPIERISIASDLPHATAYVSHQEDESRRIGVTKLQLMDDLVMLLGGAEAEKLILGTQSSGAAGSDLVRVRNIAKYAVEYAGMGNKTGMRQYSYYRDGELVRDSNLSEDQKNLIDAEINDLISEAQKKCADILKKNKAALLALKELLLEKKTMDAKDFGSVLSKKSKK